jgi:hypothetical protein
MDKYRVTIPGQEPIIVEATSQEDAYSKAVASIQAVAPTPQPQQQESGLSRATRLVARGAAPVLAATTTGAVLGAPAGPAGSALGALGGSIVIPAADALTALYNLVAREDVQLPSAAIEDFLTRLGMPVPESRGERMLQAGGGALTGAGSQLASLQRLASATTSPVTREVAKVASAAPGYQLASSAPSAATAQYVTEATGSPLAGMVAGTVAGTRPGAITRPDTAAQLKTQASAAYNRADQAVKLTKEAFDAGFDPGLHPKVKAVLDRLESEGSTYKTLREMENLRRIVRAPEGDFTNPDQQRIASMLVDKYDDLVDNISAPNIFYGDEKTAVSALNDARSTYAKAKKQQTIEDMIRRADIRAAQMTQGGTDNALRTEFSALARNDKRMAAFSKEEKAQINEIAKGGGNIQKFLRGFGRLGPRLTSMSAIQYGTTAGSMGALGVPPEVALAATGAAGVTSAASRAAAEQMRQAQISRLMSTIASGQTPSRTQEASRLMQLLPPTALRGLLSSQYQVEQ